MELERRSFQECRIESVDNRRLKGYALVFDAQSLDLGGFREIIAPEAVDRTLSTAADVRALVDHDSAKIIGRTRSGTLVLRKDRHGLAVTIEPDQDISYAKDIMRAVDRGDVTGMSFGFMVREDSWNYEGKTPIRTVLDMDVREVSIVTFPAYPDTSIAMRSLQDFNKVTGRRSLAFLQKVQQQARVR